jgi:hypothetical protein
MTRLANGPSFRLESLIGKTVAQLIGATDYRTDERLEMLFLRVGESNGWHRMFLQAGIGFWEVWDEADAFCDYDDLRLIDFTDRWNIASCTIISAECIGGTWDDSVLSRFVIALNSGTLQLSFCDSGDMDSDAVLAFEAKSRG